MSASDIALNYAAAFIDSLKSPEDILKGGEDLATFNSLLEQIPVLTRVLGHPGLRPGRRKEILDQALARTDPHPASRRLFHLIVEKERVAHVKSILARFNQVRDARLNLASAEVVTAIPVEGATRGEWEAALSRLVGRKVRVTYLIDTTLLGGAVARVGSVVYDGSIGKQLARMRGILLGADPS